MDALEFPFLPFLLWISISTSYDKFRNTERKTVGINDFIGV